MNVMSSDDNRSKDNVLSVDEVRELIRVANIFSEGEILWKEQIRE